MKRIYTLFYLHETIFTPYDLQETYRKSNEYPQPVFSWRNSRSNYIYTLFAWTNETERDTVLKIFELTISMKRTFTPKSLHMPASAYRISFYTVRTSGTLRYNV